jgi:photosystem II stability/assembly factor-like uncharacterized protein
MADKVVLLVGTKKGSFIFESSPERRAWSMRGPFCDTWPIHHVVADPKSGAIYAGGGNEWFGPAVWKSTDLGATWTHSNAGLAYAEGETPVKAVWSLAPATDGALYAGVEPAGLFKSTDGGLTWAHVDGLHAHPSRSSWVPGAGGLILHSIVPHPTDTKSLWVGISTAGVFHTADGGATWTPRNRGTRADFLPEDQRYPEHGQCVHCVVRAPGTADLLYQQNHCGMYRSADGGITWQSIEAGLPSSFGFPAAVHPRDPATVYLVPLNGDIKGRFVPEGKAAVWRTRDSGDTWAAQRTGLPQENAFFGVLRQALAVDQQNNVGVYFGTTSGRLYASTDEGERWTCIADHLPLISSVETMTLPG